MLIVDLEDLEDVSPFACFSCIPQLTWLQYEGTVSELVSRIRNNAKRYILLFSDVIDKLMPEPTRDISHDDDVLDVIMHQRREKTAQNEEDGLAGFPPQLMRR
jgi:DNA replication licensing factor MCM7